MSALLSEPLPATALGDVKAMVASAVVKFRRRSSSPSDRRDAVRDLADVMELLRSRAQGVLDSADEKDLFHLANKFGLRHLNEEQKLKYDKDIWYDWMFYYYLASISAFSRLIDRIPVAADVDVMPSHPATRPLTYSRGTKVRHARLGEGTVLASRRTRTDEEVTVQFAEGAGIKTLIASIAHLEILPE